MFKRIGIFAKPTGNNINENFHKTCNLLEKHGCEILLDDASTLNLESNLPTASTEKIGGMCDLILVIGGDGTLLKAAKAIVDNEVPIVGINSGNLGFLADVRLQGLEQTLLPILNGDFFEEQRFMLNATLVKNKNSGENHLAVNEVVLHHGDIARLIEFQIFIDEQFVVSQRADGVIISTPTGSTAYALSGGGSIIYPTLEVISLMPMFPHALNTRPILIDKNSKIRLVLDTSNQNDAKFSCDGQTHISLSAGDEVDIKVHHKNLRLLHPKTYNYFAVLREKLGWNRNPKD